MFRAISLVALALVASTLALPQASGGQCGGAPIQCCDSTYDSHSYEGNLILNALNKHDVPAGTMIATGCGGGTVNTGGGSACLNTPVCCDDNSFGAISFGCAPIPIVL